MTPFIIRGAIVLIAAIAIGASKLSENKGKKKEGAENKNLPDAEKLKRLRPKKPKEQPAQEEIETDETEEVDETGNNDSPDLSGDKSE